MVSSRQPASGLDHTGVAYVGLRRFGPVFGALGRWRQTGGLPGFRIGSFAVRWPGAGGGLFARLALRWGGSGVCFYTYYCVLVMLFFSSFVKGIQFQSQLTVNR